VRTGIDHASASRSLSKQAREWLHPRRKRRGRRSTARSSTRARACNRTSDAKPRLDVGDPWRSAKKMGTRPRDGKVERAYDRTSTASAAAVAGEKAKEDFGSSSTSPRAAWACRLAEACEGGPRTLDFTRPYCIFRLPRVDKASYGESRGSAAQRRA
jgi:hypothetical protein